MNKSRHIHIISEERSGSSSLSDAVAEQHKNNKKKVLKFSEVLRKKFIESRQAEEIINKIEGTNPDEVIVVLKNHYYQFISAPIELQSRVMNLNAKKIGLLRRNKLDQALSLSYMRTLENCDIKNNQKVNIDKQMFSDLCRQLLTRFNQHLEWAKRNCDEIIWYEDIPWETFLLKTEKNDYKIKYIENIYELTRLYYRRVYI